MNTIFDDIDNATYYQADALKTEYDNMTNNRNLWNSRNTIGYYDPLYGTNTVTLPNNSTVIARSIALTNPGLNSTIQLTKGSHICVYDYRRR
jgi:SMC interacting uncharacterized protein involved in chromosome segregation